MKHNLIIVYLICTLLSLCQYSLNIISTQESFYIYVNIVCIVADIFIVFKLYLQKSDNIDAIFFRPGMHDIIGVMWKRLYWMKQTWNLGLVGLHVGIVLLLLTESIL